MGLNTNLTATAKKKNAGANDIFEKCRAFTRPGELQKAGLYMYFETFGDRDGCQPGEVWLGSSKVLMFGSNDYLGLITHPQVKEAAVQAIRKYGSGCSGSRLLNGTLDLHVKLEAELAAFVRKEAAMIFGTGQLRCAFGANRKGRRDDLRSRPARQLGGRSVAVGSAGDALPA
jgi:hypothetical protein